MSSPAPALAVLSLTESSVTRRVRLESPRHCWVVRRQGERIYGLCFLWSGSGDQHKRFNHHLCIGRRFSLNKRESIRKAGPRLMAVRDLPSSELDGGMEIA